MKNENVIKKFLEGEEAKTPLRTIVSGYYSYKGRTLWTKGNTLINYNTRIAYIEDNTLYINTKKYSSTTSHIHPSFSMPSRGVTVSDWARPIASWNCSARSSA